MNRYGLRVKDVLIAIALSLTCGIYVTDAVAYDIMFHGYLESNIKVRDTTGFQYGFFDEAEAIQQKTTLKMDLDVLPDMRHQFGNQSISLEKFHFTYRGFYDSIFDLRSDEWDAIPDDRPGRYNYGLDDLRFENEMREASFDIVYDGSIGNSYIRAGRQLVGWGETSAVVLLDRLNPADISNENFFANPDDLKIPLWGVRYNHSLPPIKNMSLSFDLFASEVRPYQLPPTDASHSAPYSPFGALEGIPIDDDVADDDPQFGAKIGATLFQYLDLSLVYIEGINAAPVALDLYDLGARAQMEHPRTETYGGYFSLYTPIIDTIIKGEYARTEEEPLTLDDPVFITSPEFIIRTWDLVTVNRAMIGVDKNVWARWLSDSQINLSLEYIHTNYEDWDDAKYGNNATAVEDSGMFFFMANGYWLHGNVNPLLQVWYLTEDVWSTGLSVRHNLNQSLYYKVATQVFWGDRDAQTPYTSQIDQTEVSLTIGYQW